MQKEKGTDNSLFPTIGYSLNKQGKDSGDDNKKDSSEFFCENDGNSNNSNGNNNNDDNNKNWQFSERTCVN